MWKSELRPGRNGGLAALGLIKVVPENLIRTSSGKTTLDSVVQRKCQLRTVAARRMVPQAVTNSL